MKTLLVIFAHPDDESHGPAGTIAKYAAEGVQIHYLCATRGEAGSVVDSRYLADGQSLADVRTGELQQAVKELGIHGLHFMNYRDSGMEGSADNQHPDSLYNAPLDDVAERIAEQIRRLRPDAIITHDEYGWYGHPDHIKCYQATKRAYELLFGINWEGETGATLRHLPRLYVSSFSKWWLKVTTRLMPLFGKDPRRYGQNQDVNLLEIAGWDVPLTTKIRVGEYLATKDKAVACHASQHVLTRSKVPFFDAFMRRMQATESFSRLYPPVAADERAETSLFGAEVQPTWERAHKIPSLA